MGRLVSAVMGLAAVEGLLGALDPDVARVQRLPAHCADSRGGSSRPAVLV